MSIEDFVYYHKGIRDENQLDACGQIWYLMTSLHNGSSVLILSSPTIDFKRYYFAKILNKDSDLAFAKF